MVTIKDIAKYCGCSISTVSYALNDSDLVSEKTKERIRQAAKELNYTPNAYASGLKRKKTYNIGVVISGFDGPIHHNVLAGISNYLQEINSEYRLLVTIADEKMFLIKQRIIDLAIIMDARANKEIIKELSKFVPIVTFDHFIIGDNIYNTTIDNMQGMYLHTKDLISKGCKKIAYMLGSKLSTHNKRRFDGYVKAFEEANMQIDESIIFDADAFTEQRGFDVIDEIISKNEHIAFDALVCSNDELAIGAIKALQNNGYNVPYDVKVTGFDNIEKGALFSPSLSTVHVDWRNYGEEMAKFALDILNGKEVTTLATPVKIIKRQSSMKI